MSSIRGSGTGPIDVTQFRFGAGAESGAKLGSELFSRSTALRKVMRGEDQLGRGDRGAGILRVQKGLQQIGIPLPRHGADGRWHDELRGAVVQFQGDHGLDQSGVVDAATLAALDDTLATAESALDEAGEDGSISTKDLRKAEKEISAKYGPERGRQVLIAALGQDPTRIEFDAVDYIQGDVGDMNGHVETFQRVLVEHLQGAKVLDSNFDGRLDPDDLVFTEGADGQVDVERIGQALCDRVKIGGAMVDAAFLMGECEHRFGDLEFNPGAWEFEDPDEDYEDGMGIMVPAHGVPPSLALKDIFKHPKPYQFECATALTIIRYKAMLELLGPEDFDTVCADLRIGPWKTEDDAKRTWKVTGDGQSKATKAEQALVKPGEYTYFKNWDVSKDGFDGGWQGENVLSLGDGLYFGHPFGITDAESIVEHLNTARKEGSTRSASLLDIRARIDASILKLDKNPTD